MYVGIKKIFNRPLTPHLTIYSSQITSLYSIWHRVTGMSMIFLIIIFLSLIKFSAYGLHESFFRIFYSTSLWFQNSVYLNTTIFLLYHMLNGIRHIIWDLGFFLPIKNVNISIRVINLGLICYVVFSILKIIS